MTLDYIYLVVILLLLIAFVVVVVFLNRPIQTQDDSFNITTILASSCRTTSESCTVPGIDGNGKVCYRPCRKSRFNTTLTPCVDNKQEQIHECVANDAHGINECLHPITKQEVPVGSIISFTKSC